MYYKYADYNLKGIVKKEFKTIRVDEENFNGFISILHFIKSNRKAVYKDGELMEFAMSGDKWIEFYPDNSHISLIACYNSKNEITEWYFDIAKSIGCENGMPYEEDLYLDVIMEKDGSIKTIDKDELDEALKNKEITMQEYNLAIDTEKEIYKKIKGKLKELKKFTDKYLKILLDYKENDKG